MANSWRLVRRARARPVACDTQRQGEREGKRERENESAREREKEREREREREKERERKRENARAVTTKRVLDGRTMDGSEKLFSLR